MEKKRYLVSLKLAAEYAPGANGESVGFNSGTHEEYIVTNDTNESNGLEEVSDLIAKLLAKQGAFILSGNEVRAVVSFRKYIEATIYPADASKEAMLDLTLTQLRAAVSSQL